MNEAVRKILDDEKTRFLEEHNLTQKEYVPYVISGKGTDDKGQNISFKLQSNALYNIGDSIKINRTDGSIVSCKISQISYSEIDGINYKSKFDVNADFPYNRRCYTLKPVDVTDEEYKLLRETLPKINHQKRNEVETNVGIIIIIIGVIIAFIGAIAGLVIGFDESAVLGWTVFLVGIIQMLLFMGFGTVISLLDEIANRPM